MRPIKPHRAQARSYKQNMGDRLVVGLRTLTPPAGVRIPLPQPNMKRPPNEAAFFIIDECLQRLGQNQTSYPIKQRHCHPNVNSRCHNFPLSVTVSYTHRQVVHPAAFKNSNSN